MILDHSPLQPEWVAALAAAPVGTFVTLERTGNRVSTVGLLTTKEAETPVTVQPSSRLILRPDRLPDSALHLTMLNLTPLYWGVHNVGWLVHFPALNVTVGRNYVKVVRGKPTVTERDAPQLTAHLKSLVLMEVPDTISLLLSVEIRDISI